MTLPRFIGVGAAKCGTTMLYQILNQHKNIFMPQGKECHFFNSDEMYSYGVQYYESRFFMECNNEKAVGEITPLYMLYDEVPERIYEVLGPDVKLIFCFRNPAKRAYSNYLQNVRMLWENESFEKALEIEPERIAADRRFGMMRAYIRGGYYSQQLEKFLKYFPRKNIFYTVFEEDLVQNRKKTIQELFSFLEIEWDEKINLDVSGNKSLPPKLQFIEDKPVFYVRKKKKYRLPVGSIVYTTGFPGIDRVIFKPSEKTTSYFRKLESEMTRDIDESFINNLINQYFMDDIQCLEKILNRDLSIWYKT